MKADLQATTGGKRAGKTTRALRRRESTRVAGFSARATVAFQNATVDGYALSRGASLSFTFSLPTVQRGAWIGFGGWLCLSPGIKTTLINAPRHYRLDLAEAPNWSKFGSLWQSDGDQPRPITLQLQAYDDATVATWGLMAGGVSHEHLHTARPALLHNMWRFAPEANFYDPSSPGHVIIIPSDLGREAELAEIFLKSCNRCGRFLPINVENERFQLSFSNHCVAWHRRPCSHTGFGRISDVNRSQVLQLTYGFQLECRFCKKFEVNAAHNPQRTAAQMKEDGARRRAFELLLEHLYGGSPQLNHRDIFRSELADEVWERFDGRCFKCGTTLATPRDMQLDHTRPLAMLWPLDRSATALCATHNSEKRDRPPVEFYTNAELEQLSKKTDIPLHELRSPTPNLEAVRLLHRRLDWFYDDFLAAPELAKTHDGKQTRELLLKALRKVVAQCPEQDRFELP